MKSAHNLTRKINPCGRRRRNAGKGTWIIIGLVGLGGLVLLTSLKKKSPVGPAVLPRKYDWTVPTGNIAASIGAKLPAVLDKIPSHWLS